jgi:hypothetical protein
MHDVIGLQFHDLAHSAFSLFKERWEYHDKKITSQATNHVQRLLLMLMFILIFFISSMAGKNRLGFEIFYYFELIFVFLNN